MRKRPDGFAGLASIVVSQQLSTASARAIWGRLEAAFDPFDHMCGVALANGKACACRPVGAKNPHVEGDRQGRSTAADLDLASLADRPADEAHAALTAIHGIGPWTADIYLLFCLGHADAWPAGDLALQEAARLLFKLRSAADGERDAAAGGTMAAVAWRRRLHAVDVLSRRQEAGRRADPAGGVTS